MAGSALPAEGLGWNSPCPPWGGTHHVHPGAAPASPQRVSQPPSSAWAPAANKFHPLPQQNANFIMVIKIFTCHTPCTAPHIGPKKTSSHHKGNSTITTPPGWTISTLSTVPSSLTTKIPIANPVPGSGWSELCLLLY